MMPEARLHHVQLAIPPDGEAESRRFYVGVLGLTEIAKPPVLAGRGGFWVRAGALEIHLGVETDFRPQRKAHPGIQVGDLDDLAARLTAAGAPVTWDGNFPGMRRIYTADPHGNRLEFLSPCRPMSERRRTGGRADRLAWTGVVVGAAFLSGVVGGVVRSTSSFPRPGASAEQIRTYFIQPSRAPWISITGQLLSAVALVGWTGRVSRLAAGSPGVRAAAMVGGGVAAAALGTAAGCAVSLASDRVALDRVEERHRTNFLAGGPVHGAGFGLLLAAMAVAGRRSGRLPPWLSSAAAVAAAPNLLAPLYLRWPGVVWLVPGGRFPGLIVTGTAGAVLARQGRVR